MEPEEFLRLVAGELCPCGHGKADHAQPLDDEAYEEMGLTEVMGPCEKCDCGGVVE